MTNQTTPTPFSRRRRRRVDVKNEFKENSWLSASILFRSDQFLFSCYEFCPMSGRWEEIR